MASDLEFAQAFTAAVDVARYRFRRTVLGGKRVDATTVTLAGAPEGKSWVRGFDESREQTAVWGSVNAVNAAVEIDLRIDGDYEIVGINYPQTVATHGDAALSVTQPRGLDETVPRSIPAMGFVPGRLEASRLGGLYVHVRSFWYDTGFYDGDALNTATGLPTLNDFSLSGYTPAMANFSQWVVIWLDPSDASLGKAANTAVFGTAKQLSESAIDLSVVPSGCYPLGAVGLAYGQTIIDGTSRMTDARYHLERRGGADFSVIMMSPDGFPMASADGYMMLSS